MSDIHSFFLGGQIDFEVAGMLIVQMQNADADDPTGEWEVVISSDGGDVEAGTALYEVLKGYSERGGGTHHVTTIAAGTCSSMATLVMQAGDWRVTGPLTIWGLHHAYMGSARGTVADIRDETGWLKDWEHDADLVTLERSTLSLSEYHRRIRHGNWFLRGDDLVKYGFVDEVRG